MEDNIFLDEDKLKEECGVIGIYDKRNLESSQMAYYGLIGLQHRGQESAGIAVNNERVITCFKEMGLVQDVFDDRIMSLLKGDMCIGHVRYSTTGESFVRNAQPIMVKYSGGNVAVAHNGNLVNAWQLRKSMEANGTKFVSTNDSEVIANLIAQNLEQGLEYAVSRMMDLVKGSYALVVLTGDVLIGVRDRHGLRPLCLGKLENGYVFASESCALDILGAEFVRDVKPGEIVMIDRDNNVKSIMLENHEKKAICIFEYIYFARPDSIIDEIGVYQARREMGRTLAKEHPVEADVVICVPDSGTPAAHGFAEESGIPYAMGLIKNRYIGRTFIQPNQALRELSVRLKLNPMKCAVKGKRVVMVDDSIVRGTTSQKIVASLRKAGATEVHVRVSSPMVIASCYFGIDTPDKKELVGANEGLEAIRSKIGADSLGYLSLDGVQAAAGGKEVGFCTACFSGDYPIEIPEEMEKHALDGLKK